MSREATLSLTHGPELEELWQAMNRLGFENENWPQPIEQPKFMFNNRTGLRARFKYNLSRARWEVALIWGE